MATVELIPFTPGRRPTDEARHAWLGSSDQVAFVLGDRTVDNRCYLLLAIDGIDGDGYALDVTLNDLPGWQRRPVVPGAFAEGDPTPRERPLGDDRPYVFTLVPDELDVEIPFTGLRLDAEIRLTRDGAVEGVTRGSFDVYDVRKFGTLYARIVERLVIPDTRRQRDGLPHAYHPWFPVLLIGSHKAELYTRALIADIVDKQRNLSDPGWLVRVGIYLELLTCLGIEAAVGEDLFGDLELPDLADRLNVEGWMRVWELRGIAFGAPRTGPVGALNLLNKRRATLEFLHVHHEDLQHAIELAGPNLHNGQETWHRVFRDAERAVLRQTPDAFPELGHLPPEVCRWVLWHRAGHLGLSRALRVPGPLPRLLGDQDGLFASACNQYRASMNHVAGWAKQHGLMDHPGDEAVPRQVSLLEAHMNQPARVALLQRRDGYDADTLEVGADLPPGYEPPIADLAKLLAGTALFSLLRPDEIDMLAHTARPLTFGPMERIIVQGQQGDSLFVVLEGAVEVLLRRDGTDVSLGSRPSPTVLGEMSLLTGEPRSATVRAVEGALVYEIGRRQYEPILLARPELVDALERAMESRLSTQDAMLVRYDADRARAGFARRIRRLLASA
jgi:CRP-like cAMP-binding protein